MLLKEPLLRVTKDSGNSTCTASMASGIAGFRLSWSRCEEWSKIHMLASDQLVAEVRNSY
jgi:hypothetical protein